MFLKSSYMLCSDTMVFSVHTRDMPALECIIGNNQKCVYCVQYVTVGFKDHEELPNNAITVFSFAVEARKASGIKQLKQLIVDVTTTFWYNEEKFKAQ